MVRFSEELNYTIINRMMLPKNESINTMARERGYLKLHLSKL